MGKIWCPSWARGRREYHLEMAFLRWIGKERNSLLASILDGHYCFCQCEFHCGHSAATIADGSVHVVKTKCENFRRYVHLHSRHSQTAHQSFEDNHEGSRRWVVWGVHCASTVEWVHTLVEDTLGDGASDTLWWLPQEPPGWCTLRRIRRSRSRKNRFMLQITLFLSVDIRFAML